MPRRIIDYPVVFGGWHSVISSGHMLSVSGMFAFFLMITLSLRKKKLAIRTSFGIGRYNVRVNFYCYEIIKLFYIKRKYYIFPRKKINVETNKQKTIVIKPNNVAEQNKVDVEKILYTLVIGKIIIFMFYKFLLQQLNIKLNKFIYFKQLIDYYYKSIIIKLVNTSFYVYKQLGNIKILKTINNVLYYYIKYNVYKLYTKDFQVKNTFSIINTSIIPNDLIAYGRLIKQHSNIYFAKSIFKRIVINQYFYNLFFNKNNITVNKNDNHCYSIRDIQKCIFVNMGVGLNVNFTKFQPPQITNNLKFYNIIKPCILEVNNLFYLTLFDKCVRTNNAFINLMVNEFYDYKNVDINVELIRE